MQIQRVDFAGLNPATQVSSGHASAGGNSLPAAPTHESVPIERARVAVAVEPGNTLVYRFLDRQTGDVFLQVPPEQALHAVQQIEEQLHKTEQPRHRVDFRG
jgi:hypothetical protein